MFSKLKIKTRLIVSIMLLVVFISALVISLSFSKSNQSLREAEQRELEGIYDIALAQMESRGQLATSLAEVVALTPEVQRDFANRDREALAARTVPMFEQLKQEFNVRQFQFHTEPATSFFRAHSPAKFGDDLSSFRKTVIQTNQTQKPVTGLERGVAGIGIRGIVPVYYQQQHVGSVEFGMSLNQSFFEQFKVAFGVDSNLYTFTGDKINTFASTTKEVGLVSQTDILAVFKGEQASASARSELNGVPVTTFLAVVPDYSGQPLAVIEIIMDTSHNVAAEFELLLNALMGAVIALIIGVLVAYFIAVSIINPINRTAKAMEDIAHGNGDLTARLDDSARNEIGELAARFNQFSTKVHDIVVDVKQVALNLNVSADQLANVSDQTNANIQGQQIEIEQLSTAMNEMIATVQDVARNTTDAAASTELADQATSVGLSIVQGVESNIDQLADEIKHTAQALEKLELQSSEIDTVLEVILSIAEQTNLLALNAAIEAARAGEQGRGFAVVADEVRALASRTQHSTEEIKHIIEELQQGAKLAVKSMQDSIVTTDRLVDQAGKAGQSLNEINSTVDTINGMNIQIASAANEQVSVSEEINRNVVNINNVVMTTVDACNQTNQASEEVKQLAKTILDQMSQFKVKS